MKFILNRGKAMGISLLFFCFSCGDADLFDTDKWSSQIDGWTPEVTLKVAQGEFSLWDLINQGTDSVIIKEGANDLAIQYIEDDIYRLPVEEIFSMPSTGSQFEVALPDLNLPTGNVSASVQEFELTAKLPNIPDGCELKTLVLSGDFSCIFPYAGFDYHARIVFENIETGGSAFTMEKDVTSSADGQKGVWGWDKAKINLDGADILNLRFEISVEAGTSIGSSSTLGKLVFQLEQMEFESAEGKIVVAEPIDITPGSFNMNVDFLDEIGGKFKFTKPELSLIIENKGIGVPVQLANISFENQGVLLKLNAGSVLSFQGNPDITEVVTEVQTMDKENSNIVDFLSMPPSGEIHYSGKVEVNPEETFDNKITQGGEMTISARVRIPFSLSAEELTYADTLTDIDVDEKIADKIMEGRLHLNVSNGIPLTLNIPALVLLNENGMALDTVKCVTSDSKIGGASQGKPTEKKITYELNKEQAKKLSLTKNILLKAIALTENNQAVDIKADDKLKFSLMVDVKAEIKDYDDF